jgi:hypothetical protein
MASWREFSELQPELAGAGRRLLYQYGVGLAFLATTRTDGGPRVHPMCPIITDDDLYAFIVPGPKRGDLHRDGRYAMHSFPAEENEDAFSFTGRARQVTTEGTVADLSRRYATERALAEPRREIARWELFRFDVESCLLTRTNGHGDPDPRHQTWHGL